MAICRPKILCKNGRDIDAEFYNQPRFVTHIDDGAIQAITDYYAEVMFEGADVLDLCSSWISHLPADLKLGNVVGVGMNGEELQRNERLSSYEVQDLNVNPKLPYEDDSFDFVCNVVSVDYLIKPREIFEEMNRVLRPGGKAIMSFSNRCFPTKAIGIWTQTDDAGHLWIVGSYFKFGGKAPTQRRWTSRRSQAWEIQCTSLRAQNEVEEVKRDAVRAPLRLCTGRSSSFLISTQT